MSAAVGRVLVNVSKAVAVVPRIVAGLSTAGETCEAGTSAPAGEVLTAGGMSTLAGWASIASEGVTTAVGEVSIAVEVVSLAFFGTPTFTRVRLATNGFEAGFCLRVGPGMLAERGWRVFPN